MEDSKIVNICKCLSDLNRLKILELLALGEKCACDLLEELDIKQSTLSYHMKLLSECDLIFTREEGKWNYYSINCETFKDFKSFINRLECSDLKRENC